MALNPWPRGPNATGGYQLDGRFLTLQEQALGALLNHAQIQNPPQQRLLDDLSSFQRVLFTNERVRALSEAIDQGVTPLPDADPPLDALEQQGKAVFTRSCAQCHGGPGQSTTQAPVVRFHDIFAQCPRPVDTGCNASPALQLQALPAAPRAQRANLRNHAADGAKIRRTSSDPGRALLTGFVGVRRPAGTGRLEQARRARPARAAQHRAVLPQQQRRHAGRSRRPLHRVLQAIVEVNAPPGVVPPVASTDGVHFDRELLPEERAALLAYLRKL